MQQSKSGFDIPEFANVAMVSCNGGDDSSSSDDSGDGKPRENAAPQSPFRDVGSLRGLKGRRPSFLPPPADDSEQELMDEMKRSCTSNDCNLAALRLTGVPKGLPIATLAKLSLSENSLTTLPESLFEGANGQHLVDIDINSNQLRSLPVSLFFLPKLEILMLNHNRLTKLPDAVMHLEKPPTAPILPALQRVGLEFNELVEFPTCFFRHCAQLREVLLGQNERLLSRMVSLAELRQSPMHADWAAGDRREKVVLRLDNRPRLMAQVAAEEWATALPWLELSLHKVYPDKVLDYLFLGSMRTAQTVSVYHDLDIRYVLTIGRALDVRVEPDMQHKVLHVDDYPGADITAVFAEAFAFIDAARAAKKGVLIHCFAGLSRSVTIAAAYIMKVKHLTCEEAMALIQKARPAARPNEGFLKALKANEEKLMSGAF